MSKRNKNGYEMTSNTIRYNGHIIFIVSKSRAFDGAYHYENRRKGYTTRGWSSREGTFRNLLQGLWVEAQSEEERKQLEDLMCWL